MTKNKKDENYARERLANSPLKVNKKDISVEASKIIDKFIDFKEDTSSIHLDYASSLPKSDS